MYLTYTEYQQMGGTADSTAFSRLSFRAEKLIDRYTQKRVAAMDQPSEAVQRCIVELVEAMAATDPTKATTSPMLTGFSNDGYSESYSNSVTADSLEAAYHSIIRDFLSTETDDQGTPLMYMGVDG